MGSGKNSETVLRAGLVAQMPRLWRFAYGLCGRADMADDLVQSTCTRALERAHQLTDPSGLSSWLLTICRSIWLNEVRSQSIRAAQSLDSTPDPALRAEISSSETNILASEVFSAVMALPEAQRATVVLVLVEGFSYREAAGILDVPIGTVMSRLNAARARMRAQFGEDTGPLATERRE